MIHKTKGIVLRTVKYGETSLVVSCFTELYGVQSYMVNGIRTISKKGASKATFFQPAAILDLVVYHNDFKNLQRIKEYKWSYIYRHIYADVFKNAVALFMVELVSKCVKQPEENEALFSFIEDALMHLDDADATVTANYPLFFALHLAGFFGFGVSNTNIKEQNYLDLQEGVFTSEQPRHSYYLQDKEAEAVSEILRIRQPEELNQLKLNQDLRRRMIIALETYYALHISDFGTMKTLPVLREITN
ncbi:MAG TPA: DNA repair protein RecO [Chitinophagaceae bacterium]